MYYDVLCWLSFNAFNECFDVNYDKYATEQRVASQLLDNNTARQSAALSLTRPSSHEHLCFRATTPDPRTTQLIAYDSYYNRSSDVWCDGAIVIRRDSKVGPFIRRTSIKHD